MATENAPLFPVSGNNEANTHRFVLALGPSWRERFIKRRASRLLQHCILYNAPSPETIKSVSRAEVLRTDTGTEEERGRERERDQSEPTDCGDNNERAGQFCRRQRLWPAGCGHLLPSNSDSCLRRVACSPLARVFVADSTSL